MARPPALSPVFQGDDAQCTCEAEMWPIPSSRCRRQRTTYGEVRWSNGVAIRCHVVPCSPGTESAGLRGAPWVVISLSQPGSGWDSGKSGLPQRH